MKIKLLFTVQERLRNKYVAVKDAVKGFKAIIDGEVDDVPEQAFFNTGTIEDVLENAKKLEK